MTVETSLVLALSSAFVYGVSNVFAKLCLTHMHPVAVASLFTFTNLVIAAPIGFATVPFDAYRWEGVASFALMGIVGYAGLRLVFAVGIRLLGVSRHAPISGIYPMLAALGAFGFLGERPAPAVWVGMTVIVVGILWIAIEPTEESWGRRHLSLPVLQAFLRSVGVLFRKAGLFHMNTPVLAIAIGGLSGMSCLLGYLWVCRKEEEIFVWTPRGLFFGAMLGLSNTFAQYLYTVALSRSDVSVVVPIISTAPVFAIFLTKVFLREVERVGYRRVLGGLVVVTGTAIITLR